MLIRICVECQRENNLTPAVEKADKQGIKFTHGLCVHHYVEGEMKSGVSKLKALKAVQKIIKDSPGHTPAPYLKGTPELLNQYKQGIFTQPLCEDINKQRLQKLAGII